MINTLIDLDNAFLGTSMKQWSVHWLTLTMLSWAPLRKQWSVPWLTLTMLSWVPLCNNVQYIVWTWQCFPVYLNNTIIIALIDLDNAFLFTLIKQRSVHWLTLTMLILVSSWNNEHYIHWPWQCLSGYPLANNDQFLVWHSNCYCVYLHQTIISSLFWLDNDILFTLLNPLYST